MLRVFGDPGGPPGAKGPPGAPGAPFPPGGGGDARIQEIRFKIRIEIRDLENLISDSILGPISDPKT